MVRRRGLYTALVFLTNLILIVSIAFATQSQAGESGTFTGTWVANGTREVLPFGENRSAALFKLAGHVNLQAAVGTKNDYWAECIGLADTLTGSDVRCVWRSTDGQEIYLVLRADRLHEGSNVTGTFAGGTGAAAGISGSISFHWSSLVFQTTNNTTAVGGYARDMSGTYQLP